MSKVFLCLTMLLFILAACNNSNDLNKPVEDGLVVVGTSYGIGGDLDNTTVTYFVNLSNRTNNKITIKSIEPIIEPSLMSKLIDKYIMLEVNQEIMPGSSKEFKGEFKVNTKGLNKEEISNLIKLKEYKIITEQIVGRNN